MSELNAHPYTIAVASGKGGTGKTTVAVGLAQSWQGPMTLLDCDVEEPNCALFLHPEMVETSEVRTLAPVVDASRCTGCGACARICQFNAIAVMGTKPVVFPELCHACGGCAKVCPEQAIREESQRTGMLEIGHRDGIRFVQGALDVGKPMATPVIDAVREQGAIAPDAAPGRSTDPPMVVVDCPPGASCPLLAAVTDVDYVLLVTEPTPFGLNDLRIAVETMRVLKLPFGVVLNRSDIGMACVKTYCEEEGIPLLLEIPEDRRIAEAYSRGESLITGAPQMAGALRELLQRLVGMVGEKRASEAYEEAAR